jgi:hypothetical protein
VESRARARSSDIDILRIAAPRGNLSPETCSLFRIVSLRGNKKAGVRRTGPKNDQNALAHFFSILSSVTVFGVKHPFRDREF